MSQGYKFRTHCQESSPLKIVGVINAYVAMMAEEVGFKALYLSGAGVANACLGLPDLGVTSLDNVLEEARRITSSSTLPLLVDIDTGWGSSLMIERTIKEMISSKVAAIHIEDQVFEKRCGHRDNKQLVSCEEMCNRLEIADKTRKNYDPDFVIMARTDALANEKLDKTLKRLEAYKKAGADMFFIEALTSLEDYHFIKQQLSLPILANITEFGKTPLFTTEELSKVEVDMMLFPLSVWRAMNYSALHVLQTIHQTGSQASMIDQMQTREELYHFLDYKQQENTCRRSSHV